MLTEHLVYRLIIILTAMIVSGCGSVEVGIGPAYLLNVPERHLTGSTQFHVSAVHRASISDRVTVETGWNHISNGAQIGIGGYPNRGIDIFSTQLKYRFHINRTP